MPAEERQAAGRERLGQALQELKSSSLITIVVDLWFLKGQTCNICGQDEPQASLL